jgi:hypothetical protein
MNMVSGTVKTQVTSFSFQLIYQHVKYTIHMSCYIICVHTSYTALDHPRTQLGTYVTSRWMIEEKDETIQLPDSSF